MFTANFDLVDFIDCASQCARDDFAIELFNTLHGTNFKAPMTATGSLPPNAFLEFVHLFIFTQFEPSKRRTGWRTLLDELRQEDERDTPLEEFSNETNVLSSDTFRWLM